MLQKTTKNILWNGECSCLLPWNQLYSWERITWTIGIPSRIQKISQWNKCSTYLRDWCLNKMRWFMEVFVFDWWWTSHQSSAHKGLRLFRFCTVSWQDTRELQVKRCMGRKFGVVQNYTGIQKLGLNWLRGNGIRVENFSRIQDVAAQSGSQKFTVEIRWDTWEFHRKDNLHVDV